MDRKVGPYLYKDGWMAQKKFSAAGGSSVRTFTVVIAAAFDAGIVGSEHNGIAIIDEDHQTAVLDRHAPTDSGYFGPTELQKSEFHRIMAMDWSKFSTFCRTNPRFYNNSPDIAAGRDPDDVEEDGLREAIRTGRASETGKDIRNPDMKKLDDAALSEEAGGLSFPCRTREQMIVHLANHRMHAPDRHGAALAWDVKVHNFDTSGKGPEKTDPAFDARWKEYVEKHDDLFWEACADGLRQYVDGEYSVYPGEDQGAFRFGVTGRSGGWLYLKSWNGPQPGDGRDPMTFESQPEFIEYLRGLAPADLCRLYRLVANVDHDLRRPAAEVEFQLNWRRSQLEEEWRAEAEASPAPRL